MFFNKLPVFHFQSVQLKNNDTMPSQDDHKSPCLQGIRKKEYLCSCVSVDKCTRHVPRSSLSGHIKRQVPTLVFLPAWYCARFQRLTRICTLQPDAHNRASLLFAHTYFDFQTHKTRLVWFEPTDLLRKDDIVAEKRDTIIIINHFLSISSNF